MYEYLSYNALNTFHKNSKKRKYSQIKVLVPSDKTYLLKEIIIFRIASKSEVFSLILSCQNNDFIYRNLNFADLTYLEKLGINVHYTKSDIPSGLLVENFFYPFISTENGLEIAHNPLELNLPLTINIQEVTQEYVDYILNVFTPQTELINILNAKNKWSITVNQVPQFSSWEDVIFLTIDVLHRAGDYGPTFEKLGYFLRGKASKIALKKYGENHAKCCELLDLTAITTNRPRQIYLTSLGKIYYSLESKQKDKVILHQILRMPLIREIITLSNTSNFCIKNYLMSKGLSEKTSVRRKSNIKTMIQFLYKNGLFSIKDIID